MQGGGSEGQVLEAAGNGPEPLPHGKYVPSATSHVGISPKWQTLVIQDEVWRVRKRNKQYIQ